MSLAINIDAVDGVLLADGWHKIHKNSFEIDAYEFLRGGSSENEKPRLAGGQEALIPAAGATWTESDGTQIFCPLTAVLAVRYGRKSRG
jgi:hypothetical protein